MMEETMQKKYYEQRTLGPFINKNSTLKTYVYIAAALVPQVLMLFLTKSYANLLVVFSCVLACLFSEILCLARKKHVWLSILRSVTNGILTGFFLPADFPLAAAFFITLAVSAAVQSASGDTAVPWLHPVAVTVVLCWFVGRFYFPEFLVTRQFLLEKNPSLALIQEGIFPTFRFDEAVTSFFNETVFALFKVSVPQGYFSVLWDSQSVIPAFRFNLLTLLSSVFLIGAGVISFDIPFCYLTSYLLLVKFVSPFFSGGIPFQGDMILALLSSGTLFTAFFLLQFFGTTPMSKNGRLFYGVLGGIFAFLFSGCGTSPVGSAVTVLFLSIASPVIQYFENRNMCAKLTRVLEKENV